MSDQRAIHLIGNSNAARFGERFRVLVRKQRTPDTGCTVAAEGTVAVHAGEHVLEHRIEEHGFEILRRSERLRFLGFLAEAGRFGGEHAVCERVERLEAGRRHCEGIRHHITSMSAWIAPAALIACRMVIRSRGPMPIALRPSTTCCRDTPSRTTNIFFPSSWTPMLVRGTTRVLPRAKGSG